MKNNNSIALGTAAIGRPSYINIQKNKSPFESKAAFAKKGLQILDKAYDLGIRYFDTAPGYGMAEQLLIDWAKRKSNDAIEIATKWGYTYVADFKQDAKVHEVKEHSISKLNEQWETSKALLPNLKIYQIHSATLDTGVFKNQAVLNQLFALKNEHAIQIGISVSGANQLEILKTALNVEVEEQQLFDVFQVTYNIFDQSLGSIAQKMVGQNKKLVIKEALANGRIFTNEKYPHYAAAYEMLNELAKKYGVGVDAVALRFCLDSLPTCKVLSGAATEAHLMDNLKALKFEWKEEELAMMKTLAVNPGAYWTARKSLEWN